MQITPSDLSEAGQTFPGTFEVELADVEGAPQVRAASAAEYQVHAQRDGADLEVAGWVACELEVVCDRCLQPYGLTVRREFEVAYRPLPEGEGDEEHELDEDDLDLDYYRGDSLELEQLLVEQILLSLPMKPLCDEECKGLCPTCGANRNREACDCEPAVDPRLASLAAIKKQL